LAIVNIESLFSLCRKFVCRDNHFSFGKSHQNLYKWENPSDLFYGMTSGGSRNIENMKSHRMHDKEETSSDTPCALLWDESLIWGLMARQALMEAGLDRKSVV
jgi:hypothetical protein